MSIKPTYSQTPGQGRPLPAPRKEIIDAFRHRNTTSTAPHAAASVVVQSGGYTLPAATAFTLGGVKVGPGLSISLDGTLSGPGQETTVTLASQAAGLTAGNWRIGADFSAFGLFGDLCYRAVLTCSDPSVIVETNEGPRTAGKAFWTLYVPASYAGTDPLTLTATLRGVWSGAATSGLPATWDAPAPVG